MLVHSLHEHRREGVGEGRRQLVVVMKSDACLGVFALFALNHHRVVEMSRSDSMMLARAAALAIPSSAHDYLVLC